MLTIAAALPATAEDESPPAAIPVGTTVDLSVATAGPIRGVAVGAATYLAVDDQGLWVLHADGKTIERVSAPLETISALATDGTRYYIGAAQGLFVGAAGEWEKPVTDVISALCIQPDPPLYLAGSRGMWRSEDGVEWSAVPFADSRVVGCAIAGTTAYAATTHGIFRSSDAGLTWTDVSSGLRTRCIAAVAMTGQTVYAAAAGEGLYRSTDAGATWTHISSPVQAPEDVAAAGEVVSLLTDGTLWRSIDGGQNWQSSSVESARTIDAAGLIDGVGAVQ